LSAPCLCEVPLEQRHLDALDAVLRARKAGELSDDEAMKRLERSPSWVGTVLDPTSQVRVGVEVGTRTWAMAQRVVHQVTRVSAPGGVSLCLTDGFQEYRTAILAHCGQWMHPARRQDQGPMPQPRWGPLPALLDAPGVQSSRRQRLVGVTHRVVFGTPLAIAEVVARWGWRIKTAFVERLTLDIRPCVAAMGRRVNTRCQGQAGLLDQLV
jgi:hypothetical protein